MRSPTTVLTAVASSGAAALHFYAAGTHAGSTADVVAFTALAWVQLGLAAALLLQPSLLVRRGAAVVSAVAIGAWALSRTAGLPWGAHEGLVEDVGSVDLLAVGLEAAVVAMTLIPERMLASVRTLTFAGASAFVAIALFATVAVATPADDHAATAGHDHAAADAHPADAHPADAHPADEHPADEHPTEEHRGHVSVDCTAEVTGEQQAAADALVVDTQAAVLRFEDFAVAVAEGYVPITPEDAQVVHYADPDTLGDGETLDPQRVESLIYAFDRNGTPYFLGSMYLLDDSTNDPPMPGGCLTTWHAHDNLCTAPGLGMVSTLGADGSCPAGSTNEVTPMMLHVWSIELSTGPFSELHEVEPREVIAALAGR